MEGGELKRQRRESSIQVTQGDATLVQDSVAQIFFCVVVVVCVFFLSSLFSFFLQKKIVGLFFFFKILPKKFSSSASFLEWYYTFDFATLREKKTRNKHTARRKERAVV